MVDTLSVNYNGHVYTIRKVDYWCPNCGMKQIWIDNSDDYYEGCNYVCYSCRQHFTMPRLEDIGDDKYFQTWLKAIKNSS